MTEAVIDLWWFPHDPPAEQVAARATGLLGAGERARLRQFDRPEAAGLFALRRAIRRVILAEYLDADAAAIMFDEASGEKPRVSFPVTECEFNASDTAGLGVVAVTRGVAVGTDIEALRTIDVAGFERRILTPAERKLLRQTSQEDRRQRMLLRAWTAKEAVLKGIGTGLDLAAMRQIGVEQASGRGTWQPVSPEPPAGPGQGWNVWFHDLPGPQADPQAGPRGILAIAAVACRSHRPVNVRSAAMLIGRHGLR